MALKDWKKLRDRVFVRVINDNKRIHIFKNKIQTEIQKTPVWYVDISDNPHYEVKDFPNRTKALAYAKAYMKKH